MAPFFLEPFGQYDTGNHGASEDYVGQWGSVTGGLAIVDLGGGRKYMKTYNIGSNFPGCYSKTFDSTYTTIVVGFRFHNLVATAEKVISFYDGGTWVGSINRSADGKIYYEAGSGALCTTTGSTAVGDSNYYEVKIVFHNSAGTVDIKREGTLDNSASGLDTMSGGSSVTRIGLWNVTGHHWGKTGVSDLYLDDADYQGVCGVAYEPADTAGSSDDFTATGDTNNEDCVDEIGPDDDTTYNRSTVIGDLDQLNVTQVVDASQVLAVATLARVRSENVGLTQIKLGLLHSGSHGQGSAIPISQDYTYHMEIFEDVPGGSGWTPTQQQDAEVSYENA